MISVQKRAFFIEDKTVIPHTHTKKIKFKTKSLENLHLYSTFQNFEILKKISTPSFKH